jgi:hypothetical protein
MAMNETSAEIFESEVDRLIKEGNTSTLGKDKGGNVHAHKLRDD